MNYSVSRKKQNKFYKVVYRHYSGEVEDVLKQIYSSNFIIIDRVLSKILQKKYFGLVSFYGQSVLKDKLALS